MSSSPLLRVEREAGSDPPRFRLIGTLDELSDLSGLATDHPVLELDLAALDGINSFGVRAWMTTIQRLCAGATVRLLQCPPIFVNHMNMTAGFIADAQVVSFLVPFACEDCDEETDIAFRADEVRAQGGALPEARPCDCGETLVPDVLGDMYLRFLEG